MSNLFVPIDSSNLSELLPEGDDVVYSGFCNVKAVAGNATIKWKSHVLVSKSGLAAFTNIEPSKDKGKYIRYKKRKKKEGMIAEFLPWEKFGSDINKPPFGKNHAMFILNRGASILKRITVMYKDPNLKGFGHFCRDIWLDTLM